ncbi:MAG: hypothetical protein JO235_11270, partial [Chroococcidiopsidaceae cyanobacterium CP_BM_RX_35]|nr:hypothetical protein [Chroococcidiopsidaceae cyanobacterium CP_BM_RX_35]
ELEATLEPVFVYFKESRKLDEKFGDFYNRVGREAVQQFVVEYRARSIPEVIQHS